MEITAQHGDNVKVHYTGRFTDGTIFDSSTEREPLSFLMGAGQMIKGFEAAVLGMSVGEKKTTHIPAEQAYGQVESDMFFSIPKQYVPQDMPLELGLDVTLQSPEGDFFNATIVEILDESITLDANHPLAGRDLSFDIELVDVIKHTIA